MFQSQKQFLRTIGVGILILAVALIITPLSSAQDEEIQRLRSKISELEKRISDLEALLSMHSNEETIKKSGDLSWENKKNWRKLRLGMTENEVKTILGNPIKTIDGVRTLWYYPNLYCGLVSFDKEGRLTGWNEP